MTTPNDLQSNRCPDCQRPKTKCEHCVGGPELRHDAWRKSQCQAVTIVRLRSELEALTQAAVGALGYLPVNVPGARMAKERIEAVLAGMGVAVEPEPESIERIEYNKGRIVGARWLASISSDPEPATKPLGKVADCPDCSSIDYCKAHLVAMMGLPASEPRAIVVGSTWREQYHSPSPMVEVDFVHSDGAGVNLRNKNTGWMFAMTISAFRDCYEWVSDPPATSGGGEAG